MLYSIYCAVGVGHVLRTRASPRCCYLQQRLNAVYVYEYCIWQLLRLLCARIRSAAALSPFPLGILSCGHRAALSFVSLLFFLFLIICGSAQVRGTFHPICQPHDRTTNSEDFVDIT